MKNLKLSFTDKLKWETIKATLQTDGVYADGIQDVFELGQLPKPPQGEDEEWTYYEDYAVDMVVTDDYDYSSIKKYLASIKGDSMHSIVGFEGEIVVATPDSSWLKADIQNWLTDNGIKWSSDMTKAQLLNLI